MTEVETQVAGSTGTTDAKGLSIGQYLIQRLQDYGIRDLFGIPGDYVLSFYSQLEKSPINVVGCTARRLCGVRGGRLCAGARDGRDLCDVLCWRI